MSNDPGPSLLASPTERRRVWVPISIVVVSALLVVGCSDTDRTAGRFCTELQAQLPALTTPVTTSADVDDLVDRFKQLNRITPLTIEDEWQVLTDLVQLAADVVPGDTQSLQELTDAAYKAERPVRSMTEWVETTCGLTMPDVIGIEGN